MSAATPAFYPLVLVIHSYVRWLVLAAGIACLVRLGRGWRSRRTFGAGDETAVRVLVAVVDVQFLLGLLLYAFLSPISSAGLRDLGAALHEATLRFFTIEHPFAMILALTALHAGTASARRLGSDPRRHGAALVAVAIALAVIAVSIPWPGLAYARPLLRGVR